MTDIIDIFSKAKLSEQDGVNNLPKWSWEREIENVRTIQRNFHTLDAYTKGVALNAIAENYVMLLEAVFIEFKGEKV